MTETTKDRSKLDDLDVTELFDVAAKAFKAIKRKMVKRIENDEEDALDELSQMHQLARAFQSICASMANRPPFARAGAVLRAIEYGNVERAVHGHGKVYPPTRHGVFAYLTHVNKTEIDRWRRLRDEARDKYGIYDETRMRYSVELGVAARDCLRRLELTARCREEL